MPTKLEVEEELETTKARLNGSLHLIKKQQNEIDKLKKIIFNLKIPII